METCLFISTRGPGQNSVSKIRVGSSRKSILETKRNEVADVKGWEGKLVAYSCCAPLSITGIATYIHTSDLCTKRLARAG